MTSPVRATSAVVLTMASALVLVLAPGVWTANATTLIAPLRQPGEAAFIASHRGDRANAPENTIPAFTSAVASGADFVETDLRLTADGYAVVMHDATVDRTTNGSGAVADLTLAELRTLDAGSWYDAAFAGTPVPLFEEFLDVLAAAGDVTALVELKGTWNAEEVRGLLGGIYFRGLQDRIVFASFSPVSLVALRAGAPELPRVYIRRVLPLDPAEVATRFGAIAIMTRPSALEDRPEVVDELHEAGLGILLYTLNTEKRWSDALGWGVDGIVTDDCSALGSWLAESVET